MFQNRTLKVEGSDGRNFVLLEPLIYVTKDGRCLRAAAGSTTDGASTPQEIWNMIPPFGTGWFSYIIHDAAYRDTLEVLDEPTLSWNKITLDFDVSNRLLDECMESQNVGFFERKTIYDAVCLDGRSSFDRDRKTLPNASQ